MGEVIENEESIDVPRPDQCHVTHLHRAFHPNIGADSALIVLNQEITIPRDVFISLWNAYGLKICADGGANRLYDISPALVPDYIVGDLDSLKPDVKQWYESKGVEVIKQSTQYATDMQKAIDLVEVHYHYADAQERFDVSSLDTYDSLLTLHSSLNKTSRTQMLMVGAIDGRFDHTIQSISVMLKRIQQSPDSPIFFLTRTNLIFAIPKGLNYVDYTKTTFQSYNCGLLPLAGDTRLTTKGLKWDVIDWDSSLTGSVSTSNRLVGTDGIVVQCDKELIINVEMAHY